MNLIHKETLKLVTEQILKLPTSAIIRKVALQQGNLCVWYQFDEMDYNTKDVIFKIVGTGFVEIEVNWVYLDSIFIDRFVWHIFQVNQTLKYDFTEVQSSSKGTNIVCCYFCTFCTEFDKAYWSLEIAKELSEADFTIKQKYDEDILEVSWYVD